MERRLATIIEHLLKLQFSPATHAHAGWRQTIRRSRQHIASLLKGNRTLREKVPALIAEIVPPTAQRVAEDLQDRKELEGALLAKLTGAAFTEDEILGGWFPANTDGG